MPNSARIALDFQALHIDDIVKALEKVNTLSGKMELPKNLVNQINDLTTAVEAMQASASTLSKTKVDSKEFKDFSKTVLEQFSAINQRVSILEDAMLKIGNKQDVSGIVGSLKAIEDNANNASAAIDKINAASSSINDTKKKAPKTRSLQAYEHELEVLQEIKKLENKEKVNGKISTKSINAMKSSDTLLKNLREQIELAGVLKKELEQMYKTKGLKYTDFKDKASEYTSVIVTIERLQERYEKLNGEQSLINIPFNPKTFEELGTNIDDMIIEIGDGFDHMFDIVDRRINVISTEIDSLRKKASETTKDVKQPEDSYELTDTKYTNKGKQQLKLPIRLDPNADKELIEKIDAIVAEVQEQVKPIEIKVAYVSKYKTKKANELAEQLSKNIDNINDKDLKDKITSLVENLNKHLEEKIHLEVEVAGEKKAETAVKNILKKLREQLKADAKEQTGLPPIQIEAEFSKATLENLSKQLNEIDFEPIKINIQKVAKGKDGKDAKLLEKEYTPLEVIKKSIDKIRTATDLKTTAFENEVNTVREKAADEVDYLTPILSAFLEIKNVISDISSLSGTLGDIHFNIDAENLSKLVNAAEVISSIESGDVSDSSTNTSATKSTNKNNKSARDKNETQQKLNKALKEERKTRQDIKKVSDDTLSSTTAELDKLFNELKGIRESSKIVESYRDAFGEDAEETVKLNLETIERLKSVLKNFKNANEKDFADIANMSDEQLLSSAKNLLGITDTVKQNLKDIDRKSLSVKSSIESLETPLKKTASKAEKFAQSMEKAAKNSQIIYSTVNGKQVPYPLNENASKGLNRIANNPKSDQRESANAILQLAGKYVHSGDIKVLDELKSYVSSSNLSSKMKSSITKSVDNVIKTLTTNIEDATKKAAKESQAPKKMKKVTMTKGEYKEWFRQNNVLGNSDSFDYNFEKHLEGLARKGLAKQKTFKNGRKGKWQIQVEVEDTGVEETKKNLDEVEKKEKELTDTSVKNSKKKTDAKNAENKAKKESVALTEKETKSNKEQTEYLEKGFNIIKGNLAKHGNYNLSKKSDKESLFKNVEGYINYQKQGGTRPISDLTDNEKVLAKITKEYERQKGLKTEIIQQEQKQVQEAVEVQKAEKKVTETVEEQKTKDYSSILSDLSDRFVNEGYDPVKLQDIHTKVKDIQNEIDITNEHFSEFAKLAKEVKDTLNGMGYGLLDGKWQKMPQLAKDQTEFLEKGFGTLKGNLAKHGNYNLSKKADKASLYNNVLGYIRYKEQGGTRPLSDLTDNPKVLEKVTKEYERQIALRNKSSQQTKEQVQDTKKVQKAEEQVTTALKEQTKQRTDEVVNGDSQEKVVENLEETETEVKKFLSAIESIKDSKKYKGIADAEEQIEYFSEAIRNNLMNAEKALDKFLKTSTYSKDAEIPSFKIEELEGSDKRLAEHITKPAKEFDNISDSVEETNGKVVEFKKKTKETKEEIEQLGYSANRVLSEIGLSYDEYVNKINSQKRGMDWGERLATVVDGKIQDSIKGTQIQVGWTDAVNIDSLVEKILHFHPQGKGQSEVFSSEDILEFFEKVLSKGYNVPFELWQNGQKTSMDFRGIPKQYLPHVVTALSQVQEIVAQNLKQNNKKGTIKSVLDSEYQQLTNSLFKAIFEKYGGKFKTEKDFSSKIDPQLVRKNLAILEEYTHYIRGDKDNKFHGEDDASSYMFLKDLFKNFKDEMIPDDSFEKTDYESIQEKITEYFNQIKEFGKRIKELGGKAGMVGIDYENFETDVLPDDELEQFNKLILNLQQALERRDILRETPEIKEARNAYGEFNRQALLLEDAIEKKDKDAYQMMYNYLSELNEKTKILGSSEGETYQDRLKYLSDNKLDESVFQEWEQAKKKQREELEKEAEGYRSLSDSFTEKEIEGMKKAMINWQRGAIEIEDIMKSFKVQEDVLHAAAKGELTPKSEVAVSKDAKDNQEEVSKFAGKTNEELQQCLATEEKWLARCKEGTKAYNSRKANIEEINALLSSSTISSDSDTKIQDTKQEVRDFLNNLPKVSNEIAKAIDKTLDKLTEEVAEGAITAKQALEELNVEISNLGNKKNNQKEVSKFLKEIPLVNNEVMDGIEETSNELVEQISTGSLTAEEALKVLNKKVFEVIESLNEFKKITTSDEFYHLGHESFDKDKFQALNNYSKLEIEQFNKDKSLGYLYKELMNKPMQGGLWGTITPNSSLYSNIKKYEGFSGSIYDFISIAEDLGKNTAKAFAFHFKENAKVLVLQSLEDLENLPRLKNSSYYDYNKPDGQELIKGTGRGSHNEILPDWEYIGQYYDGIVVLIDKMYESLSSWDLDSVVVTNPNAIEMTKQFDVIDGEYKEIINDSKLLQSQHEKESESSKKQNESLEEQKSLYDQIYERIEKIRMLGVVGGSKDEIKKNLGYESKNLQAYEMQMKAIKKLTPTGEMNPDIRDAVLNPDKPIEDVAKQLVQAAEDYITCKKTLDQIFEKANIAGGKIYDDAYNTLKLYSFDSEGMADVVAETKQKISLIQAENKVRETSRQKKEAEAKAQAELNSQKKKEDILAESESLKKENDVSKESINNIDKLTEKHKELTKALSQENELTNKLVSIKKQIADLNLQASKQGYKWDSISKEYIYNDDYAEQIGKSYDRYKMKTYTTKDKWVNGITDNVSIKDGSHSVKEIEELILWRKEIDNLLKKLKSKNLEDFDDAEISEAKKKLLDFYKEYRSYENNSYFLNNELEKYPLQEIDRIISSFTILRQEQEQLKKSTNNVTSSIKSDLKEINTDSIEGDKLYQRFLEIEETLRGNVAVIKELDAHGVTDSINNYLLYGVESFLDEFISQLSKIDLSKYADTSFGKAVPKLLSWANQEKEYRTKNPNLDFYSTESVQKETESIKENTSAIKENTSAKEQNESVAQKNADKTVKLYDTLGREIDSNNSKILEGTKLIDESTGKIQVLYHGSNSEFDKFESSFIGKTGTRFGPGAYFSFDESGAKPYGRKVSEWFANITKIYDDNAKISEEDLTKIFNKYKTDIKKLWKNIDLKTFLSKMSGMSPSEQLQSLGKITKSSEETGLLKKLGFQGRKFQLGKEGGIVIFDLDNIIKAKDALTVVEKKVGLKNNALKFLSNETSNSTEDINKETEAVKENTSAKEENIKAKKESAQVSESSAAKEVASKSKAIEATNQQIQAEKKLAQAEEWTEEKLEIGFQKMKNKIAEFGNFNLSKKTDKTGLSHWVDQYIKYQNLGGQRSIEELTDNPKALEKLKKEYKAQTEKISKDAVDGLSEGIKEKERQYYDDMEGLMKEGVKIARKTIGAMSPAEEYIQVSIDAVDGLIEGLKRQGPKYLAYIKALMESGVEEARKVLEQWDNLVPFPNAGSGTSRGKIATGASTAKGNQTEEDAAKANYKAKGRDATKAKADSDKISKAIQDEINARKKAIDETDAVITSLTEFKDSNDNLVKEQIKSREIIDGAVKKTTTTVNYDTESGEPFSSDIDVYDYDSYNKKVEAGVKLQEKLNNQVDETKSKLLSIATNLENINSDDQELLDITSKVNGVAERLNRSFDATKPEDTMEFNRIISDIKIIGDDIKDWEKSQKELDELSNKHLASIQRVREEEEKSLRIQEKYIEQERQRQYNEKESLDSKRGIFELERKTKELELNKLSKGFDSYDLESQQRLLDLYDKLDSVDVSDGWKEYNELVKQFKLQIGETAEEVRSFGDVWQDTLNEINQAQRKDLDSNLGGKKLQSFIDETVFNDRKDYFKGSHDSKGNWTGALAQGVAEEIEAANDKLINATKLYQKLTSQADEYYKLLAKEKAGAINKRELETLENIRKGWIDATEAKGDYERLDIGSKSTLKSYDQARENFLNSSSTAFDKIQNGLLSELNQFNKWADTAKEKFQKEFAEKIILVRDKLLEINEVGLHVNTEEAFTSLGRLLSLIDEVKQNKDLEEVRKASEQAIEKAKYKIEQFMQKNSGMGKEYLEKFQNLKMQFDAGTTPDQLRSLTAEFVRLEAEVTRADKLGKGFFKTVGEHLKSLNAQFLAQYFSFQDMIRYARTAFETIHKLDTALVDLKKTTTMSNSELEDFYHNSSNIAKQMGVSSEEIIAQASAWSRLGYSSKEAAETMAELSSQFAKISPGTSVEDATDYLVSTMKAFDIDVTKVESDIMDSINRIGNTMATSNQEVGEMLKRSSAAMAAANNSLAETIALESAAVQITRNAETTGTAFRTISMRIRGYDEETEEVLEDYEQLKGTIANLTKTAKTPGGISLFTDETKTEFKSTYQLLKEIAEIYKDLTDKDQAALLEALAGKRGGQVLAGILNDFSEVERAMGEIEKSAGSADKEMGIIEESFDYKINALKETWVGFLTELADRGALANLIDMLTKLSEVLTGLLNQKGAITGILSVIGGALATKNNVGGLKNTSPTPLFYYIV